MSKQVDSIPIEWLHERLSEYASSISYMANGYLSPKEKIKLEAVSMLHGLINEYQQEMKSDKGNDSSLPCD